LLLTTLEIVDINGRAIQVPINNENYAAGVHSVSIPVDMNVAAGTYVLRLTTGTDGIAVRTFQIVK